MGVITRWQPECSQADRHQRTSVDVCGIKTTPNLDQRTSADDYGRLSNDLIIPRFARWVVPCAVRDLAQGTQAPVNPAR